MNLSKLKNFNKFFSKGFTLIELLIVIAILGILAAGILVAIDPADKILAANDAKVQNDISNIGKATEAFAVVQGGAYPGVIGDLVTYGELKRVPSVPSASYNPYSYNVLPAGSGCTSAAKNCTGVVIYGELKSKKYSNSGAANTPFWRYESSTGKSCARPAFLPAQATDCP